MARKQRILILGGTADARKLADLCFRELGSGVEVISSLAGTIRSAKKPAGVVRVGGFGGHEGLADYLVDHHIELLVDATHPFAATISSHAVTATAAVGIPHVTIHRPTWHLPTDLTVHTVGTMAEAATCLSGLNARVAMITTGIKELGVFANLSSMRFVIRQIDHHDGRLPFPNAEIIVRRPPFDVPSERQTMRDHAVDVLVTKESGGTATEAKITAAHELDIPVVMIRRPAPPTGHRVSSPAEALAWIKTQPVG